jgi:hypothetical protein
MKSSSQRKEFVARPPLFAFYEPKNPHRYDIMGNINDLLFKAVV